MSKRSRKTRAVQGSRAEETAPSRAGSRLLDYLAEHPLRVSLVLVMLATLRIAATYAVFNHTIDEPAHIACGMEWLDRHAYALEPHHPPLARVVVALGPYLAGARSQGGDEMYKQNPFQQGALILYNGEHYGLYLLLARLGVLPFFWVAAFAVYWWSQKYYGGLVASLAIFLLTFLPPFIGHAGLATNDMAVTAFVGGAFVALLAWLDHPIPVRSLIFGASVGLAVLSKFTALAFVPVSFLAALIWYVFMRRPALRELIARLRVLALPFLIAVLAGALTIWAGYRFSIGFSPALRMRVPAPELFNGIQGVLRLGKTGYPAYLLGQHSKSGWWYYYLVVLAVKTPLPFLFLLLAGGAFAIKRRAQLGGTYALPLIFSVSLLLLSFFSHVNTGVRYVLAVYVGFSITAAIGAAELLRSGDTRRWALRVCAVMLAWFVLSSAVSHPDYIAYSNELVGSEPETVIADSDLDWGQHMNRVGKRLQELGARQVAFGPFILADLSKHGWPAITPSDPQTPSAGWNAVSITVWKVARMGFMDHYPNAVLWPDLVKPTERVGKGVLLYYFPPAPAAPGAPRRGR
jgi:4-amino-4-deoxy-L-arabinose transferase-like glycosyltransferase